MLVPAAQSRAKRSTRRAKAQGGNTCVIGAIDIGGTKIAAAIVNQEGRILHRSECPTNPEQGFAQGLEEICVLRFHGLFINRFYKSSFLKGFRNFLLHFL